MGFYQRRQGGVGNCPYGGFFQSCATGFRGCCLVDACTDGCPAGKDRTGNPATTTVISKVSAPISTENSNPSRVATVVGQPRSSESVASSPSPTASVPTATGNSIISLSRSQTADVSIEFRSISSPVASSVASSVTSPIPSNLASEQSTPNDHALPVAAIVGGTLGGVIALIALASLALILRKMKKRRIYQAPEYPSPLIGSDMSDQLRGDLSTESKGETFAVDQSSPGLSQLCTPQLDSRAIDRYEASCSNPASRYAELPGEPIPWPGQPKPGTAM